MPINELHQTWIERIRELRLEQKSQVDPGECNFAQSNASMEPLVGPFSSQGAGWLVG